MRNLYDILGVTIRADQKEIKKAYRTLSKRYHPDSNQGDRRAAEHFHEIPEAYGCLLYTSVGTFYIHVKQKKDENAAVSIEGGFGGE